MTAMTMQATVESRPVPHRPGSLHAQALRRAGLRATSARIAALRAAPEILARHGHLSPSLLADACRRLGYHLHLSVFYHLLPDLAAAGLIPVHAIQLPASRMAGLSLVRGGGGADQA